MFPEHHIRIVEWFLKYRVELQIGVMAAENSILLSQE